MAKYAKVQGTPGLYQNTETKIYYVRKFRTGKGELFQSTRETNLYKAKQEMNRILSWWTGAKAGVSSGVLVKDVAMDLLELYQSKAQATYENYESHYRLHIGPFFDQMLLTDVKKNWFRYCAKQKELTPTRKLGHDRRHLRRILQHAVELGFLDGVPQLKLDRNETIASKGREYSNDEINKLLNLSSENTRLKLEIQLKTGMRFSEVRLLKWEYIDFDKGMFFIPKEVIKTRDDKMCAVEPRLLLKLRARKMTSKSPFVFPHRFDNARPGTRTDKTWQRLKKRAGVTGKQHWLRHTAATRFVRDGLPGPLVQKALGMSDKVMKNVYLHVGTDDLNKMKTAISRSLKK